MAFLDKIKNKLPFQVGKGEAEDVPAKGSDVKEVKIPGAAKAETEKAPKADEPLVAELSPSSEKGGVVGSFLKKLKPGKASKSVPGKTSAKPGASNDGFVPVLESAIETTDNPEDRSILEAPPEIDEELLEEVEPPKGVLVYILKGGFIFFVAVGILSFLFYTSQLTDYLNFATDTFNLPSVTNDLITTNEEVKELKTEHNMYGFLQGKFYLDKFSFDGDEYLRNYYILNNKTMSFAEKEEAYAEMVNLRETMSESFYAARDKLAKDVWITLVDLELEEGSDFQQLFETALKTLLLKEADELEQSESEVDKRNFKVYKQTQKLISNYELIDFLKVTDLEVLTDEELADLIVKVNELVENELSAIQKIKENRITWSDIINQIELETSYVDQYFSKGYYDDIGGIQYTSYDFDTTNSTITITGSTKRFDTNNFTMISNLIDQLNASQYFEGVEMRSFTKSGSPEEGFTATLRLTLELQKDALGSSDDPIAIDSMPEFLNPQSGVSLEKEGEEVAEDEPVATGESVGEEDGPMATGESVDAEDELPKPEVEPEVEPLPAPLVEAIN